MEKNKNNVKNPYYSSADKHVNVISFNSRFGMDAFPKKIALWAV